VSEDPLEGWLPPKATGGRHPAGSDEYRPPSPAERRRAAQNLWLECGAMFGAVLLASLNTYFFSAWLDALGDQSECCSLFVPSPEWLIVFLVLNAIGALLALLAGIATLVRGTRFAAGWAVRPCIMLGLSGSAALPLVTIYLYMLVG